MTLVAAGPHPAPPTAPGVAPVRRDLPAWPLLTMLWGFPVMWALGLTVVPGATSMTIVMLALMLHSRTAVVVPGVGAFAAFVLWMVPSVVMIDTASRMAGYGFRLAIAIFVLVSLVYALSAPRRLTRRRVVNALTFVWFFVIAAGLVAMVVPNVRLSTPVGMLLPRSITSNSYVQDLFFPPLAEVQRPWGSPEIFVRPSAPFPYANSWGVAILILTPVALACFFMTRSLLLRLAIVVGAALMLVPAMATSNRGMFGALALAAAYVVVRMAIRDRAGPVLWLGGLGIVALGALAASGLFQSIATRQEYGQSTNARSTLYAETIERTLASPLIGYGAPRPSTAQELSVGTQGYIWTLMFSFGFVGLGLFLLFLWGTTLRTWRAVGDADLALHASLVVTSLVIVVYGLDIMQLLALVLVSALLLRRRYGLDGPDDD